MSDTPQESSQFRVLGPNEGASYWQPVPANGHVRNIFNQRETASKRNFSMGTQTVAAGGMVREHSHDQNEEVIFVVEGRGYVGIDGEKYPIEPGSALFFGTNTKHYFINPGPDPLTFVWYFMPGGLDQFFEKIGRPRTLGEEAPEPFARPKNIAEIEAETVFKWADQNFEKHSKG